MKNVSTILNVVLILAVGYLYYHVYSQHTVQSKLEKPNSSTIASTVNSSQAPIAYVDLDSLNEKITYIKDKRKELETEQKSIEADWQNSYRGLENQKNQFLKKGSSITQEEAEKFQTSLLQQQQQVDGKKQALTQKLNEKSYKFMDDIQKKLKDFLSEYNKMHNYTYILTTGTGLDYLVYKDSSLNITADVVKGMNEKMKQQDN
ncbi:MAG: OmpH family outer membrane protein [Bacteroidetes bacterium]|nr:OmpH family outer membrane protein [Bacteroidota bacterium]MBS1757103.1 OmpH family outer membrane protein [Bacteroidota bacterium]